MLLSPDIIDAIGYLFEQVDGYPTDDYTSQIIAEHLPKNHTPANLAASLVEAISAEPMMDESLRVAVYWALSKRYDTALIPFFRDRLAIELESGDSVIYQLLIALDNVEETIFGRDRDGSSSVLERDLNIRDARTYLKNTS